MVVFIGLLVSETAAARPPVHAFEGGRPAFGPARVLREPPDESCTPRPEHGVRWACPVTIAGAEMTAYFMVDHGAWTGTLTVGSMDRFAAMAVAASLEATWGPSLILDNGDLGWSSETEDRVAGMHVEPGGDLDGYLLSVRIVFAAPSLLR